MCGSTIWSMGKPEHSEFGFIAGLTFLRFFSDLETFCALYPLQYHVVVLCGVSVAAVVTNWPVPPAGTPLERSANRFWGL